MSSYNTQVTVTPQKNRFYNVNWNELVIHFGIEWLTSKGKYGIAKIWFWIICKLQSLLLFETVNRRGYDTMAFKIQNFFGFWARNTTWHRLAIKVANSGKLNSPYSVELTDQSVAFATRKMYRRRLIASNNSLINWKRNRFLLGDMLNVSQHVRFFSQFHRPLTSSEKSLQQCQESFP